MKCKKKIKLFETGKWEEHYYISKTEMSEYIWVCKVHEKPYCDPCKAKVNKGYHISAHPKSGSYFCNHCHLKHPNCCCHKIYCTTYS